MEHRKLQIAKMSVHSKMIRYAYRYRTSNIKVKTEYPYDNTEVKMSRIYSLYLVYGSNIIAIVYIEVNI